MKTAGSAQERRGGHRGPAPHRQGWHQEHRIQRRVSAGVVAALHVRGAAGSPTLTTGDGTLTTARGPNRNGSGTRD